MSSRRILFGATLEERSDPGSGESIFAHDPEGDYRSRAVVARREQLFDLSRTLTLVWNLAPPTNRGNGKSKSCKHRAKR